MFLMLQNLYLAGTCTRAYAWQDLAELQSPMQGIAGGTACTVQSRMSKTGLLLLLCLQSQVNEEGEGDSRMFNFCRTPRQRGVDTVKRIDSKGHLCGASTTPDSNFNQRKLHYHVASSTVGAMPGWCLRTALHAERMARGWLCGAQSADGSINRLSRCLRCMLRRLDVQVGERTGPCPGNDKGAAQRLLITPNSIIMFAPVKYGFSSA